jgi:hypothetical protein
MAMLNNQRVNHFLLGMLHKSTPKHHEFPISFSQKPPCLLSYGISPVIKCYKYTKQKTWLADHQGYAKSLFPPSFKTAGLGENQSFGLLLRLLGFKHRMGLTYSK